MGAQSLFDLGGSTITTTTACIVNVEHCILGVFTGMLYWFLTRVDTISDSRNLDDKSLSAIFLASLAFTSNFEFRPNTALAQLMVLSWSLGALIVGAAYTANLANFLINLKQTVSGVRNLNQAVLYQMHICVKKSTAHEEYMKNFYPDANFIPLESHEDTFLIIQAGEMEQNQNGGFAVSGDSGDFCTSIESQVLDYHLLQMKADGFIEDVLNSYRQSGGHVCESPTVVLMYKSTESNSLNAHDM
eukprot:10740572-Ditylum_brightwellii.AAC.1